MFVYFDTVDMSEMCLHEFTGLVRTITLKNEKKITRLYYINMHFLIILKMFNSFIFIFLEHNLHILKYMNNKVLYNRLIHC